MPIRQTFPLKTLYSSFTRSLHVNILVFDTPSPKDNNEVNRTVYLEGLHNFGKVCHEYNTTLTNYILSEKMFEDYFFHVTSSFRITPVNTR